MPRVPVATDNFNRASLGANWTATQSTPAIVASTYVGGDDSGTGDASILYNAATLDNDQYAEIVLPVLPSGGAEININARDTSVVGTQNRYQAATDGGTTNTIAKWVANTFSLLPMTTIQAVGTWAGGDRLGIEVVGPIIYFCRNGVRCLSATDISLTSGKAGISFWIEPQRGDDFEAGDLTSVAPTVRGVSAAIAATATSAANITPAFPAGYSAVADDIAVILVHHSANGPFNTPTNYTIATDGVETLDDNNTSAQRVTVFWKRLVGGDTAQALVLTTNNVTTVRGAILLIIRGCRNTGTPFEVCKRLLNAAAATISFPAVTTTLANALLLALGAYEDDPSARTTPTNWTPGIIYLSTLGNDMALNYFTRELTAAGTAISFTTTVSGGTFTNSVSVGAVLAFVPALPASLIAQERSVTRRVGGRVFGRVN